MPDAARILDAHRSRLMAIEGVIGVGLGLSNGHQVIVIMVAPGSPAKALLADNIDGCDVLIEESGEIIPLRR